ncbi:MAG: putative zinc-binding protein [Spirochaetes bacterium]|nr:putative zinc-binding protein [Spirochaetota bacterium]
MAQDCCGFGTVLLYSCSGASDVGELADRAVRTLWKEGFATKTCLAGVGANISGFLASAKGADVNIVVDGCPIACARKSLQRVGIEPIAIVLQNLGYKKGDTKVTEETIARVVEEIKAIVKSKIPSSTIISPGCCC